MKFQKRILKNGVTLLVEQRDLPVVSFGIANRFGASFETSEVKGVAHFIEHLLFTGTKTRTHEDISREIERRGGIINAFTTNDVTCYYFKLPSEHLFVGADILIDMLNNAKFDPTKFEKEKKVILEEIKMYHDSPQRHVYDKIVSCLYEKPFGDGIIGSEKTIKAMSRDFVAEYFKKHYSPENYIAIAVGNVDIDKLANYLEKSFKKENKKLPEVKLKLKNSDFLEERQGLDQAHFILAAHAPLAHDENRYALEALDAYLGNGMSSKLFLTIREERGLAYAIKSSINAEKNYSYYSIYVGTTKEAIPEVKKLIIEGLDSVKSMNEKDLEEAKEKLIGLRKVSSEESSDVLNALLFEELAGKAEDYYAYEKNIRKVNLDKVKSLSKIKSFSTAAIVPK